MTKKQLKTCGLFLTLLIPIVILFWLMLNTIYWSIRNGQLDGITTIYKIKIFIDKILLLIAFLGILLLPAGIIFLIKGHGRKSSKYTNGQPPNKKANN